MNVSPCQQRGFRFSMIFSLASLCFLVPCVVSAVGADGDGGQGFTITIFADREKHFAVVKKATDALGRIKANNPMMGTPAKGQGPFVRIMVRSGAASSRVAAVVEVLLNAGITKITIETKK